MLLLALLVATWQFSASARAQTITADGSAFSLATASSSIDDIDCIRSDDPPSPLTGSVVAGADEEPLHVSGGSFNPARGFDVSANPAVDKANIPSRTNKKPLQLAEMSFDAVILHDLGTVPILLIPVHCFYSLHEHIRERAPPIPV